MPRKRRTTSYHLWRLKCRERTRERRQKETEEATELRRVIDKERKKTQRASESQSVKEKRLEANRKRMRRFRKRAVEEEKIEAEKTEENYDSPLDRGGVALGSKLTVSFNQTHGVRAVPLITNRCYQYCRMESIVHKCPECGLSGSNSDIRTHIHSHEFTPPFICKHCKKVLKTTHLDNFISHIMGHVVDKMYKCVLCGLTDSLRSRIITHINVEHDVSFYQCPYCHEGLKRPGDVRIHIERHLEEERAEPNCDPLDVDESSKLDDDVSVTDEKVVPLEVEKEVVNIETESEEESVDLKKDCVSIDPSLTDTEIQEIVGKNNKITLQSNKQKNNRQVSNLQKYNNQDDNSQVSNSQRRTKSPSVYDAGKIGKDCCTLDSKNENPLQIDEQKKDNQVPNCQRINSPVSAHQRKKCGESESQDGDSASLGSKLAISFNETHGVLAVPLITNQCYQYCRREDVVHKCPECGLSGTRADINTHIYQHEFTPPFICKHCKKVLEFNHKDNFIRHIIGHLVDSQYKCVICGQTNRFRSTIIGHINVEHGISFYQCPYCKEGLGRPGDVRIHIEWHLEEERALEANHDPLSIDKSCQLNDDVSATDKKIVTLDMDQEIFPAETQSEDILTEVKEEDIFSNT